MPEIYSIRRALGTKAVTLTGPGDLEDGQPFPNVREAALHARDHNRANGDPAASVRLFTPKGLLEEQRPIPNVKPHTLPW